MKQVMKAGAWALAVSMVFGAGCADKAEIVRPDQQNIGAALGDSKQCTPELLKDPNGAQRFVVEWNDGDREALESEMAQGVALVKYTCDGIKVLRSCAVPGDYAYRASSRKTKSLQITDAASASANLSSPTPSASFRAAMEQGKALNLAYVMIGSMTTTVKDVTRDQLDRAACKEATHFVYQTQVGAFAIAAGERGKAMAAAEVLKYGGASAEMSSERQALAEFFYEGSVFAMGESQVAADPNRAAKYLSKACYGGVSDACFWGAAMYAASDAAACTSLIKQAVAADAEEVESYLSLVWPMLSGAGSDKSINGFCQKVTALSNPKKAYDLADKACHLSGGSLTKNACAMAGALKR